MVFFWTKKKQKNEISQKLNETLKKLSYFGRGTNEENNEKITAFNFEICERR